MLNPGHRHEPNAARSVQNVLKYILSSALLRRFPEYRCVCGPFRRPGWPESTRFDRFEALLLMQRCALMLCSQTMQKQTLEMRAIAIQNQYSSRKRQVQRAIAAGCARAVQNRECAPTEAWLHVRSRWPVRSKNVRLACKTAENESGSQAREGGQHRKPTKSAYRDSRSPAKHERASPIMHMRRQVCSRLRGAAQNRARAPLIWETRDQGTRAQKYATSAEGEVNILIVDTEHGAAVAVGQALHANPKRAIAAKPPTCAHRTKNSCLRNNG